VRGRALLIGTAIISSILGAIAVYLVLTVPNDLESGTLMKQAKKDLDARQNDRARATLSRIVQQYPRTDAAAAATVALIKLADADRAKLANEVAALKNDLAAQKQALGTVSQKFDQAAAATPPPTVEVKPPPKKKATVHHTRRRRHRR